MAYTPKTPEEIRNIVRQNALSHAVEVVKILSKDSDSTSMNGNKIVAEVIDIAKDFESWVMRTDNTTTQTIPASVKNTEPIPTIQATKECPKCHKQIPRAFTAHFECGYKQGTA